MVPTGSVRWMFGAVAGALVAGCVMPDPASDEGDPLCSALNEFADEALRTSEVQESILFKEQPMEMLCTIGENDPAQERFCEAVLANVSNEFTHRYPWQIRSCVKADGGRAKATTVPEYTGLMDREKMIRLEGRLRSGVKIEMTFTPSCEMDAQMDPGGGCYWGSYRLILVPPT